MKTTEILDMKESKTVLKNMITKLQEKRVTYVVQAQDLVQVRVIADFAALKPQRHLGQV